MNRKWTILALVLIGFGLVVGGKAFAGEDRLKPKSMGVATLLALDPIPGDALFYAGHTEQGIINSVLGGLALGTIGYAIYDNKTCDKEASEGWCGMGSGIMALFVGAPLYAATLLWDAIGGISGAASHNKEIENRGRTSLLQTFQPTLAVSDKGAFVGAQFRF